MQDDRNSLERLIDDVAREITAAPVDEGFAHRVSARVHDAEAARAPRTWLRVWVLVPAAAAVVLLAVMIGRQVQSPGVRLTTSAPVTAVKRPDAPPKTASGLMAKGSGLSGVQPSAVSAQPLVRPTTALPSLGPSRDPDLQPLTTAPIEVESLNVSPLVVAMPIEISTIAIDRIEIPAMP